MIRQWWICFYTQSWSLEDEFYSLKWFSFGFSFWHFECWEKPVNNFLDRLLWNCSHLVQIIHVPFSSGRSVITFNSPSCLYFNLSNTLFHDQMPLDIFNVQFALVWISGGIGKQAVFLPFGSLTFNTERKRQGNWNISLKSTWKQRVGQKWF